MVPVEAIRALVAPRYEKTSPSDPCHDLFHVERVVRNARAIARAEGADEDVCAAAAYLHDLDRTGSKDALAEARAILAEAKAPADGAERVMEAVERHKDKSFAPGGKRPMSLEAQVVGDADKLEAIGAIGIARAFSFGGLKGRALWEGPPGGLARAAAASDEDHPWIDALAARAKDKLYVSGAYGSTVDHFFEKLLRLQPDFATATGRRLAAERHEFLRVFLDRFFREWEAAERV